MDGRIIIIIKAATRMRDAYYPSITLRSHRGIVFTNAVFQHFFSWSSTLIFLPDLH